MKKLTKEQREFLEYIHKKHHSVGFGGTIKSVLKQNGYDQRQQDTLSDVRKAWIALVKKSQGLPYDIPHYVSLGHEFGTPKKYLKI